MCQESRDKDTCLQWGGGGSAARSAASTPNSRERFTSLSGRMPGRWLRQVWHLGHGLFLPVSLLSITKLASCVQGGCFSSCLLCKLVRRKGVSRSCNRPAVRGAELGISWCQDSVLSLLRVWIQSPGGELRPSKPRGVALKKEKRSQAMQFHNLVSSKKSGILLLKKKGVGWGRKDELGVWI